MEAYKDPIMFLQMFVDQARAVDSVGCCDKLEGLIEYCKACEPDTPEVIVLSRSILAVLYEISDHLSYYEEEIEKKFGGKTAEEWDRIYHAVLRPFMESVRSRSDIDTTEKRISLIKNLIIDWCHFDKENKE